jgi:type IV secretion system protein VirB9
MIRYLSPLCALPLLTLGAAAAQTSPQGPVPPIAVAPSPRAAPVEAAPVATARQPRARKQSRAERGVAIANREATREPAVHGFVNAVQIYPFVEGALYQLYAAPERVTDIALQPGEALISVAAGDTARWIVGDTTSGEGATRRTHVLVKPFASGLATNLVITTGRRAYHLALKSTPATAMIAVSWTYPQDALLALKRDATEREALAPVASGIVPEKLRFDYVITGDRPAWRPLRAFDDGQRTYVEFAATLADGEAPPLFLIGRGGEAQLVNYRLQGRFYVVDRLFDAAELRLGLKHQAVVRISRVGAARPRGKR